jgi:hypothetical protein
MRASIRLVAVAGLALASAACGDDSTSKTTTPATAAATTTAAPSTSAETVTTLSVEQLNALALGLADVGPDWQVGPAVNDADFGDATQIPCADMALNPTILERLRPVAGVQFEPADKSSKHMIEFFRVGLPSRLAADLDAYIGALEACRTNPPTSTTGTGAVTITTLAIPELGDQRAAYTMIGAEGGGTQTTWFVRGATVRVGAVAIDISLTEILDSPDATPTISDAQFVQLVQTAVAKLPA